MRKLTMLSMIVIAIIATPVAQAKTEHDRAPNKAPAYIKRAVKEAFGKQWRLALRVAWCESRYSLTATGGSSTGLFQIDAPNGGRQIGNKYYTVAQLKTLKYNIRAAKALWRDAGRSFYRDWHYSAHCWLDRDDDD